MLMLLFIIGQTVAILLVLLIMRIILYVIEGGS